MDKSKEGNHNPDMHHQVSIAYEGIDTRTPKNVKLCAKYTKSFAYYTIKDRLPVILTKTINDLVTHKEKIISEFGQASGKDLKSVIGKVSKLKNEVVTNKSFVKLCSKGEDVEDWNNYLESQVQEEESPCWFYSPWLYAECYMYRRLWEIFESSDTLQNYDPFMKQKQDAFYLSLAEVKFLGQVTLDFLSEITSAKHVSIEIFKQFLKLSLWSNRSDLSLSNGAQIAVESFSFGNINALDSFLLIDDLDKVYDFLSNCQCEIIDFVNDNAALEVFSDLCLCDVLCASFPGLKIKFHVKKIPWFVSDTTKEDIIWLLDALAAEELKELSHRWKKYFQEGSWAILEEKYWTLPFDFSDMKAKDGSLYKSLKDSNLIIFKGDLNYRKLLGDINCDHCEKFDVAIREFKPTNILSIRTIKSDLICGLSPQTCEKFLQDDEMWMRTGDYGTIQFYKHIC